LDYLSGVSKTEGHSQLLGAYHKFPWGSPMGTSDQPFGRIIFLPLGIDILTTHGAQSNHLMLKCFLNQKVF
jgi:hypothetical protein